MQTETIHSRGKLAFLKNILVIFYNNLVLFNICSNILEVTDILSPDFSKKINKQTHKYKKINE